MVTTTEQGATSTLLLLETHGAGGAHCVSTLDPAALLVRLFNRTPAPILSSGGARRLLSGRKHNLFPVAAAFQTSPAAPCDRLWTVDRSDELCFAVTYFHGNVAALKNYLLLVPSVRCGRLPAPRCLPMYTHPSPRDDCSLLSCCCSLLAAIFASQTTSPSSHLCSTQARTGVSA